MSLHKDTDLTISSVQFSRSVMSDSLGSHEQQHVRTPCPSSTPGVYPNSCPLSWWCHPTISSSVIPFSSRPQYFPASGSFQMSQLFASCGQSTGVSASTSVLPVDLKIYEPKYLYRYSRNQEIVEPYAGEKLRTVTLKFMLRTSSLIPNCLTLKSAELISDEENFSSWLLDGKEKTRISVQHARFSEGCLKDFISFLYDLEHCQRVCSAIDKRPVGAGTLRMHPIYGFLGGRDKSRAFIQVYQGLPEAVVSDWPDS